MAILQAYFDESGKLKDNADHVVFGGVAGELDEISTFSRKWRDLLGSDVDHVHMRDAMRLQGAFKGIKQARRDDILMACAELAWSSSGMLIVSEMDKDDFLGLVEAQKRRLRDPIYGGFEGCIRALASAFSAWDFHIWYDESLEYAETCLRMYQRMKGTYTNFARRLPSITFADDTKYPGLQAADMLAYCAFVSARDGDTAAPLVRQINSILRKRADQRVHLIYNKGASLGGGILEA